MKRFHRTTMRAIFCAILVCMTLLLTLLIIFPSHMLQASDLLPATLPRTTYANYGTEAIANMLRNFYQSGKWKVCVSGCGSTNHDWGADALTDTLYFRWEVNGYDASVVPYLKMLSHTAPRYQGVCQLPSCGHWSDDPLWDSVTLSQEYEATGYRDATVLFNAQAAFNFVDGAEPTVFATGACPSIHYQQPAGGTNRLKTLETDSNYIKAALLLYQLTHDASYFAKCTFAPAQIVEESGSP